MRFAAVVVLGSGLALGLGGCGRFGFDGDPDVDGPPGGIDAPMMPDAGLGLGAFSTPTIISELNVAGDQDDDPTLPDDQLEIFFDSSRDGGPLTGYGDIWVATRTSVTLPFDPPTLIAELASVDDDTTPDITGDGLTMYFSSERLTPGDRDLFVTTRQDRSSSWSTPTRIEELRSPADDSGAIESPDHLTLVFASGRNGTGDLFRTTRATVTSAWSTPVPIPGVSDPGFTEGQHWLNPAGTVVYFTSNGPPSDGDDIWVATGSITGGFGPAALVGELSGPDVDADPWLSPDLKTIYFMSYRSGLGDLYTAKR